MRMCCLHTLLIPGRERGPCLQAWRNDARVPSRGPTLAQPLSDSPCHICNDACRAAAGMVRWERRVVRLCAWACSDYKANRTPQDAHSTRANALLLTPQEPAPTVLVGARALVWRGVAEQEGEHVEVRDDADKADEDCQKECEGVEPQPQLPYRHPPLAAKLMSLQEQGPRLT